MPKNIDCIVIAHGAFGGRHHWKKVASILRTGIGIPVYRAALTGLGERCHLISKDVDLTTHIDDVANLIEFEQLKNVCLIGHSYGGLLISAVSDRKSEHISHRIYLDAYLLADGENFFSHHAELETDWKRRAADDGDGWLIPPHWPNPHRDVPHPLATLTQQMNLKNAGANSIPSEYWLFTDGGEIEDDSLLVFYERANKLGWPIRAFPWDHNPHRNAPEELAGELIASLDNR
jgi:pimeloyl-ACP methyl ester carboxylesterase